MFLNHLYWILFWLRISILSNFCAKYSNARHLCFKTFRFVMNNKPYHDLNFANRSSTSSDSMLVALCLLLTFLLSSLTSFRITPFLFLIRQCNARVKAKTSFFENFFLCEMDLGFSSGIGSNKVCLIYFFWRLNELKKEMSWRRSCSAVMLINLEMLC